MSENNEFDQLLLTPSEIRSLKRAFRKGEVNLKKADAVTLERYNLINAVIEGYDSNGYPLLSGKYTIAYTGRRYLLYRKLLRKKEWKTGFLYPMVVSAVTSVLLSEPASWLKMLWQTLRAFAAKLFH